MRTTTSTRTTSGMLRRGRRALVRLIARWGCFFLVGSSIPPTAAIGNDDAHTRASPEGPLHAYEAPMDAAELTRVDAEMRAYFEARVNRRAPAQDRVKQILDTLFDEEPQFIYEADGTYHATEVFRRRRGNCMSFALYFVAIAREFGLRAVFNSVRIESDWELKGGFVTQSRHINVIVLDGGERIEVDIRPWWRREQTFGMAATISDAEAFASFYINLGVDRITRGDDAAALRFFRQAVQIDPHSSTTWTSLATALMHTGDLPEAEHALKKALTERPIDPVAYSTMARLCTATNRPKDAAHYERKGRRHREQNPYYHFALARAAFARGEFDSADRHLKRALDLKQDDPRLIELRIEVARTLGNEADVRRWNKALETLQAAQPGPSRSG